ncbi:MAG: DNA polymerase III subunit delta [Candidimonas sp.]|nr:MAG: DNA polymerase III subunit delta [Candidimonas sp.]
MARAPGIQALLKRLENDRQPMRPLYTVAGNEPLLVAEAMDALRAVALRRGYGERTSLTMDARGDWSAVSSAIRNDSLFGERRLIELKIPSGKPGRGGSDALTHIAERARAGGLDGILVLIGLPRLDRATRGAKWVTGLAAAGALIEIADVARGELPRWAAERLSRQNQSLDADALEWLADQVEGNLLAAHQEIQKLALLYPPGRIGFDDLERAVLNVARYDVFGLRDAMLAGRASKALTMLAGLRAEGEALPLILWAVGDEVRTMARLAAARAAGRDLADEMRKNRIFGAHEQGVRKALARLPLRTWPRLVCHAHDIDRLIKGLKAPGRLGDPWEELARLLVNVARPDTRFS